MTNRIDAEIYKLALQHRETGFALQQFREKEFPIGAVVYVEAPRFTGYGIASANSDCPSDQVPVRLENGNTWWYPVETCRRIRELKTLPGWVRRLKLAFHGIYPLRLCNEPRKETA